MNPIKTILITGATGFIGRNLISALKDNPDYTLLTADSSTPKEELVEKIREADFVAHFGGLTRSNEPQLFYSANSELTDLIVSTLEERDEFVPIIFTSSIHAEMDNDYGKSKRFSEQRIISYGEKRCGPVYVFRLTNTFGKWARPNNHSVVANFCYNISHNLDIQISDPKKTIELLYIDDLLSCVKDIIEGKESNLLDKKGQFYTVNKIKAITLGNLAELIQNCSKINTAPAEEFENRMYQTYQSYLTY